jgi:iron complex outermembrane receptor protein
VRLCLCILLLSAFPAWGQGGLADASLEQLLETRVTSVSKKAQKLSRTAAAVFVIGPEDIRRSGASNLPDLLRMVPGVDVAQINGSTWAITIRGFNSRYSNKVLVLVDGRSVYTPAFSGVYWDHLDLPLEDIDRIEVIRGPGASAWGANAVNGVINIITKPAAATKGGLVSATAGSEVYAADTLQYGGAAGADGAYRVFAKYGHDGGSGLRDGLPAPDGWTRVHAGFRSDWDLSRRDGLMVEGEDFSNREGAMVESSMLGTPFNRESAARSSSGGSNLLAQWTHTLQGGSETQVWGYIDTYRRTEFGSRQEMRAVDFDFQDHLSFGSRNDVVWGGGFRSTLSSIEGQGGSVTLPAQTDRLYSAFFQDEIRVATGVWLTAGARLEHNSYTGFDVEPSVRLAWAPSDRHTLWTAASRSIRQPARVDTGISASIASFPLDANTIETIRLYGDPDFQAEEGDDLELGYRAQVSAGLSLDLTSFLTVYRRLATLEPGTPCLLPGYPPTLEVPWNYANLASARSFGGELAMTWSVSPRWRLIPSYTFLHLRTSRDPGSVDGASLALMPMAPVQMAGARSQFNLTRRLEFDQWLTWTGAVAGTDVPGYARLDLRVGRRFGESLEISVGGQNLLRKGTAQFPDSSGYVGTEVQRSVYGKVQWAF